LLLALALAGVGGGGCGADTASACEEWVDAYNTAHAECDLDARLVLEEECPESLNQGPDCVEYYRALAASTRCDNGEARWDADGECRG